MYGESHLEMFGDMRGFPLDMFKNYLTRVPAHRAKNPAVTFDVLGALGPDARDWADIHLGEVSPNKLVRELPASVFLDNLTFDQFCKVRCSEQLMMSRSVEDLFEDDPAFAIVRKIESSLWRWGSGSRLWNELVDAYNGIRQFKVPIDGFTVRLDFTRGCNERGTGRESNIFLDGVFGFLLYYKGEHVMTLGFSIMRGRRVLVQQVQLAQRKGNRFLYKLPANRMEFFLGCFAAAFERHTLCVADGGDVCRANLQSYGHGLDRVVRALERESTARRAQEKKEYEDCIAHLSADLPRLEAFYADTGAFTRTGEFPVNGIRHYRLARPAE